MEIKTLSTELQSYLRSGFTIVSPCQLVLELVYNALDAGAKSVAVRAELKTSFSVQVIDDGFGIGKAQMDLLGQRYMTSKCRSLADLSSNLNNYGYRGECLASLKQSCEEIIIISRARGSKKTYMKVLKPGESPPVEESALKRQCYGVTVIVKNLLYNYPVRQRNVKHHLELEQMKKQLLSLCPMHPQVSFTIRDDITKSVILQIKKRQTAQEQILFLIADMIKFETSLIQVNTKYKDFEINGYISREPISQPQYQNIYINKRLVISTILHEKMNKLLVKSFYLSITKENNKLKTDGKSKYSVYFINIICPYKLYQLVSQPTNESRTFLEFTNWKSVFKALDVFVNEFLKAENFVNQEGKNEEENVTKEDFLEKCYKTADDDHQNEKSEVTNDMYSMKMVKNFQEHTRKVNKEEKTLIENENDIDVEKNQIESRSCISSKNDSMKKQKVTSLRSKIKQIEKENWKKKNKGNKKVATSFYSKLKPALSSVEKAGQKRTPSFRSEHHKKSNVLNKDDIGITKYFKEIYKFKTKNLENNTIFSEETRKNWNNSCKEGLDNGKKVFNESILTQPIIQNKNMKKLQRIQSEHPNGETSVGESIFTGIDTYEIVKNYRSSFQNDEINLNEPQNNLNESCKFDKLYELCNLNVFQWFEPNEKTMANYTPLNRSIIEPTPIKLKRKNRRKEFKELAKKRKDGCEPRQKYFGKNVQTTRGGILDFTNRNHEDLGQIFKSNDARNKTIPDQRRNKSSSPPMEMSNEADHIYPDERSRSTDAKYSRYQDQNILIINGHFMEASPPGQTVSPGRKRKLCEDKIYKAYSDKHSIPRGHGKRFEDKSKQFGNSTEKKNWGNTHYRVKSDNRARKDVMKTRQFKTTADYLKAMSQDDQDNPVDVDSYINDILSKSYRSELYVDSQHLLCNGTYQTESYASRKMDLLEQNYSEKCPYWDSKFDSTRIFGDSHCAEREFDQLNIPDCAPKSPQNIDIDIWEDKSSETHSGPSAMQAHFIREPPKEQEEYERLVTRDSHSFESYSPYFRRSRSLDPPFITTNFNLESSKDKSPTYDTFINDLPAENLKYFAPKAIKSFIDSTFFRKKFSLTPVLQSSNSNNFHTAENNLIDDRKCPRREKYTTEEKSLLNIDEEVDMRSTRKYVQFYNQSKGHQDFETNLHDEATRDEFYETIIDKIYPSREVERKMKLWDWINDKRMHEIRSKQNVSNEIEQKVAEDIALLDTQFVKNDNHVSHTIASHQTISRRSYEHNLENAAVNEMRRFKTDVTDGENPWTRNTKDPDDRENMKKTTMLNQKQIFDIEESLVINDKNSLEFNETEENFENYIRTFKKNNNDEQNNSLNQSLCNFNDQLGRECTHDENDSQNDPSDLEEMENNEIQRKIEISGNIVRDEHFTSSEADIRSHNERSKAIEDEKTLAEADTEVIDNNDVPVNDVNKTTILLTNKNQTFEDGFCFNSLGLMHKIPKTSPAIEPSFQLKDRFGFMSKGLSPLIMPNSNGADVGRLDGSDLEAMEEMMPTPEEANGNNNCIEKIVNMEEILVKTQLKSSLMNSMCHVTKDLLNVTNVKVIAQVDSKYIVVLLDRTLLVAFDQHAVDERIRVEKLISYYRNEVDGSFISHPITPYVLNLSPQEVSSLTNRKTRLTYYGLEFQVKKESDRCVKVTHVPKCLFVKLQKETSSTERLKMTRTLVVELMKEILFNKTDAKITPSSLIQMINMEACRGAIMFGKTLSLPTCYTLIKSLTRCKAPFQCAHGRPSVAPLADVKLISTLIKTRAQL